MPVPNLREELARQFAAGAKELEAPSDGPDLRLPETIILLDMLNKAVEELQGTVPLTRHTLYLIGKHVSRLQIQLETLSENDPKRIEIIAAQEALLALE